MNETIYGWLTTSYLFVWCTYITLVNMWIIIRRINTHEKEMLTLLIHNYIHYTYFRLQFYRLIDLNNPERYISRFTDRRSWRANSAMILEMVFKYVQGRHKHLQTHTHATVFWPNASNSVESNLINFPAGRAFWIPAGYIGICRWGISHIVFASGFGKTWLYGVQLT